MQIPDTFALGVQSCLDKCKIQRGDQLKAQQQPRVEGNQFPSGNGTSNNSTDHHQKRSEVAEDRTSPILSPVVPAESQALRELIFSLRLILCVLFSGYVLVWVYFVLPAWRNHRLQTELQAQRAGVPSYGDVKS